MVQEGISTEWLLKGFKYELESTARPRTVEYYCGEIQRFLRWANAVGVPSDIRLITKYHIQVFFHYLTLLLHTVLTADATSLGGLSVFAGLITEHCDGSLAGL